MTAAELQQIAQVMRREGISHLKADGLEITLGPSSDPATPPERPREYTLEDLMFAHTEGLPE